MKPESKRKSDKANNYGDDEKPSCFDSFDEMSKALLDYEIGPKVICPNVHSSSRHHDFNSSQSLSKDCYDLSSLSKTLNHLEANAIERRNLMEKRIHIAKKVIKKRQELKRVVIKPLGMNPKKPMMRIISRDIKEQNSSVGFGMEDFLDAVKHGGFHLKARFMFEMLKMKTGGHLQKGPKCI
ncbi:hypothetical protein PIB30_054320 [Stylosanthes scabra]|uniref:Uncharacterized protein n=1 Tax=Stylosanthes scabra TaxID=79078 RepID=A0ABU6TJB3_9FABA|nr:hypothetical protein [Stylosanthes scabra]